MQNKTDVRVTLGAIALIWLVLIYSDRASDRFSAALRYVKDREPVLCQKQGRYRQREGQRIRTEDDNRLHRPYLCCRAMKVLFDKMCSQCLVH